MKTTEIIGKIVLDNNANEIGKINDIDLDLKNNKVKTIYISSTELSLRKHYYEIKADMINEVGDYILLNINKKEIIDEESSNEVPDVEVVNPKDL